MQLTALTSAAELLVATDHDPFVRGSLRAANARGWVTAGATAWIGVDHHDHDRYLNALGEPGLVGELVGELVPELPPRQRVTLPRGSGARLPAWVGLDGTDWDWRWLDAAPPEQPGEERVVHVDDLDAVGALLRVASPTASALPDDADVVRWVGVLDARGGLLACAADTTVLPAVGHSSRSRCTRTRAGGGSAGRSPPR